MSLFFVTYALYLLIGVISSSHPHESLSVYLRFIVSLAMYPVGYSLFQDAKLFRKLQTCAFFSLFMILAQFAAAQILRVGRCPYVESTIFLGGSNVQITYLVSYCAIFLMFASERESRLNTIAYWTVIVLGGIMVLLVYRRGAIVAFAFGVLLAIIHRRDKLSHLCVLLLVTVGLSAIIFSVFEEQIGLVREKRSRYSMGEQGRVLEFATIAKEIEAKGWRQLLLGTELFNSENYFAGAADRAPADWLARQTNLHTDWGTLLHGAGLFGLLGLVIAYVMPLYHMRVITKKPVCGDVRRLRNLRVLLMSLLGAGLIISLSGQYYIMSSLGTWMLLMGASNAQLRALKAKAP
ncbi:MAG: hypothetical protein IH624_03320 [Phycisphaerae bacterium]|nr:hypothetical protein [Phycisphaerae bacterium]